VKQQQQVFFTKTKGGSMCVPRLLCNERSADFLKHVYRNITGAGFHGQIAIGRAQFKGSPQGNKAR
jgi:hypothetical protein